MNDLKNMDIEKVAAAIEADAGQSIPDLRESLRQARDGEYAVIHTPEDIKRRRGRPVGSTAAETKMAVKLRLDPDIVEALRSTGKGWHTRVNDTLRESLRLGGLL